MVKNRTEYHREYRKRNLDKFRAYWKIRNGLRKSMGGSHKVEGVASPKPKENVSSHVDTKTHLGMLPGPFEENEVVVDDAVCNAPKCKSAGERWVIWEGRSVWVCRKHGGW